MGRREKREEDLVSPLEGRIIPLVASRKVRGEALRTGQGGRGAPPENLHRPLEGKKKGTCKRERNEEKKKGV